MKQIVQCKTFDESGNKLKIEWFVGEPEKVDSWKNYKDFEVSRYEYGYNVFNTFKKEEILSLPLEQLKGFTLRELLKIVL